MKAINIANIKQIITKETKYISNLFSTVALPKRKDDSDDDEEEEELNEVNKPHNKDLNIGDKKSRATSLTELQSRLEAITSKKKLTYKDKMTKKGLKNRLKKKSKQGERNAIKKQDRAEKNENVTNNINSSEPETIKKAKPVYNSQGKVVFSKFDFSDIGKKPKAKCNDPKKILTDIEKLNEKIETLKQSGDVEKAIEIKEKSMWKNAIAKASGEKVKDDMTLLKKSIKRKEYKHKTSKKKWDARREAVEKTKSEKQKKRLENIDKRKKANKITKLKRSAKKGKIIPGF